MDDRTELYWRYLKDNLEHSRHHESARATGVNVTLLIGGVAFAAVGYDKCISASDIPILIFVIILGVFGALFSAKQAERASLHTERARGFREAIDSGPHAPGLSDIRRRGTLKHDAKYPRLSKIELRIFWIGLPLSMSALASALVVVALIYKQCLV